MRHHRHFRYTRHERDFARPAASHERIAVAPRPRRRRPASSSRASASATGGCRSSTIATGQQPLFNEDGSVVVVFNGEIYNFQELVPELQARGPPVPHALRHRSHRPRLGAMGPGVRGSDFAACSRSRCGIATGKRCSWRATASASSRCITRCSTTATLLFGSELKSLLASWPPAACMRDIDPLAVEEYFAYGYVAEPRTIFRGEEAAAGAHADDSAAANRARCRRQYWDMPFRRRRSPTGRAAAWTSWSSGCRNRSACA